MMFDVNNLLSGTYDPSNSPALTGQAITADAPSTNVFDLQTARDIGAGNAIEFNFLVTEDFATTVSMTIKIQSSADNITFVDLLLSPLILVANLVAGQTFNYTLPKKQLNDPIGGTPNRYLRAYYDVNTDATAGAIVASIGPLMDYDAFQPYGPNYTTAP